MGSQPVPLRRVAPDLGHSRDVRNCPPFRSADKPRHRTRALRVCSETFHLSCLVSRRAAGSYSKRHLWSLGNFHSHPISSAQCIPWPPDYVGVSPSFPGYNTWPLCPNRRDCPFDNDHSYGISHCTRRLRSCASQSAGGHCCARGYAVGDCEGRHELCTLRSHWCRDSRPRSSRGRNHGNNNGYWKLVQLIQLAF